MYLYNVNYPEYEKELCMLEMKYLFGEEIKSKEFICSKAVNIHRSPFIKFSIDIYAVDDSIEGLQEQIRIQSLVFKSFKVKFLGKASGVEFHRRHELEGLIAEYIEGDVDVHNPEVILVIALHNNKWVFGKYQKNKGTWHEHELKPYYYSNALSTRLARTIVNLAAGDAMKAKVIDPCCGIGTVVVEGLSMGIEITGCDSNPKIVERAQKNLDFFGYDDAIKLGDIHDMNGKWDAVIIDLPYGISSKTTDEERKEIIKSGSRLADRMVIVSIEGVEEYIDACNFKIIDQCEVRKMNFKRQISVCTKK